jgi:uncharacterized membrane protein
VRRVAAAGHARDRSRVVAAYLGFSTILLGIGVALLVGPAAEHEAVRTTGMVLIVIAALVRKGIIPFHAWVPEVFDHGRLGPAILFSAPQLGAYVTVSSGCRPDWRSPDSPAACSCSKPAAAGSS